MWLAAAIGTLILSLEFHCNAGEIAGRAAEWVLHAQRTKTFRRSVPMKAGCAPQRGTLAALAGRTKASDPTQTGRAFRAKALSNPFSRPLHVCFFVTAASSWP